MKKLFSKEHAATLVIAALNTVLFFALVASTGLESLAQPPVPVLIQWGAAFGPLTLTGQFWRLFTCAFLHGSVMHLIINMVPLVVVGKEVEKMFGTGRYLYIYFLSAAAGTLASTVLQPTLVSVGASGAMFGIFGAVFSFVGPGFYEQVRKNLKRRLSALALFVGLNLAVGFVIPNIDNSAHIGGLIAGLLSGFVLSGLTDKSAERYRKLAIAGAVALVLILSAAYLSAVYAFRNDPRLSAYVFLVDAQDFLQRKKYPQALDYFNKTLDAMPDATRKKFKNESSAMLLGRARAYIELKQYAQALQDIDDSLKLDPGDDSSLVARALVLHNLDREADAIEIYSKILLKNPKDAQILNNIAWSEAARGNLDQALDKANQAVAHGEKHSYILDTRGAIYALRGDNESALKDLDRAIELSSKEAASYYHRAFVRLAMGDSAQCTHDLKTADELKYEPEIWERKAFARLEERRHRLK